MQNLQHFDTAKSARPVGQCVEVNLNELNKSNFIFLQYEWLGGVVKIVDRRIKWHSCNLGPNFCENCLNDKYITNCTGWHWVGAK